jgi:UDP-N-acetylmuramate--alanine ligase
LRLHGNTLGNFQIGVPGMHNVLNATAAAAVGLELEVNPDQIAAGLRGYAGVDRRMQVRGVIKGVTVMDDYGHHPTEIRATLDAVRLGGFERVLVLFQPHRYTRTQLLLDDFARSFHAADRVYVLDIYPASEAPIEGVTGEATARRTAEFGHRGAIYAGSLEAGIDAVLNDARPGDLVLTLGAGNVSSCGEKILKGLAERV